MAKDKGDDIVDAEIVEEIGSELPLDIPTPPEAPELPEALKEEGEEAPAKMTKEEMIAAGLLPPQKNKVAEAVQTEARRIQADQAQTQRQEPKHANAVDQQALIKKAEVRGGMAVELLKAMFQGTGAREHEEVDIDAVVKFAFSLADAIQTETDRGYRQELVDATSKQLRTS